MSRDLPSLPAHDELTRGQLWFSSGSIAAAFVLLAALGWRVVSRLDLQQWWVVPTMAAGLVAADFTSGLVHWVADTWGRDDCPVIGPRLLVPFRVHHINPHDFLRRRFVDTNGEVAFLAIPVLLALLAAPIERWWGGPIAAFGLAFCGLGSMTNQIHQWAHMPSPPPVVRWLQRGGVLLDQHAHAEHHRRPYDVHYCITTGWCNRPLEALKFFRRLETVIGALTGSSPRGDDRRYEARYGTAGTESGCV